MRKVIFAFAATAAVVMSVGVAEARDRGRVTQTGNFSSGFANVSPTISVLNGSSVLSNIGIGVLGTGILSTSNTTNYTRDSNNTVNSHNGNTAHSYNGSSLNSHNRSAVNSYNRGGRGGHGRW